MKRVLDGIKQLLSDRPRLRRRIVNLISRFPVLDTRLRGLLQRTAHRPAVLNIDDAHLGEAGRTTRDRLRARAGHR